MMSAYFWCVIVPFVFIYCPLLALWLRWEEKRDADNKQQRRK